jgi:hypothetical protein
MPEMLSGMETGIAMLLQEAKKIAECEEPFRVSESLYPPTELRGICVLLGRQPGGNTLKSDGTAGTGAAPSP